MAVSLIDVLVSGAPDTSPLRGVPAYTSGGLLITVVALAALAARRRPGRRASSR